MSKGRDLHHSMGHLHQNTAACFTKGKTDTQSANTLHFGNCWLQTRAILPLFHGWLVSFGGKSLYRLPWSLKHTYLVWNGTKWDLIPVSTVFILLPERARVSLGILQIRKMFKKPTNVKTRKIDTLQNFRLIRFNIFMFEVPIVLSLLLHSNFSNILVVPALGTSSFIF